jgi:Mitochondrial K+-H+ exchange-related
MSKSSSVPNIPFFYLVYRAWSHWRALSGSKHVQFLIERNLIKTQPSPVLDALYFAGIMRAVRDGTVMRKKFPPPRQSKESAASDDTLKEAIVLDRWNSKLIAKALEIPELEIELDRALWQVETALKGKEELQEEKEKLDKASAPTEPDTPGKADR